MRWKSVVIRYRYRYSTCTVAIVVGLCMPMMAMVMTVSYWKIVCDNRLFRRISTVGGPNGLNVRDSPWQQESFHQCSTQTVLSTSISA